MVFISIVIVVLCVQLQIVVVLITRLRSLPVAVKVLNKTLRNKFCCYWSFCSIVGQAVPD
eukprot:m.366183 g.366183  ORF g.366183 m.366183 type:complete len:60 (+) comp34893_c0_seq1:81-260(+)